MADGTNYTLTDEEIRAAAEDLKAREEEKRSYRQKAWDMTQPPPDQAAEALTLGNKFGVPRQAVEADPNYWRDQDKAAQRRLMEQASPRVMAWVDNEDNYAVAKDDMDLLGSLEKYWWRGVADPVGTVKMTGSNIGRAAKSGWLSMLSTTADVDREQLQKAAAYYDEYDAWKAREAERKEEGKGGWFNRIAMQPVDFGSVRLYLPGDSDPMPQPSDRLLREAIKPGQNAWQRALSIPGAEYRRDPAAAINAIRPLIEEKMREAVRVSREKDAAADAALPQTGDFLADSLLSGVRSLTEMGPLVASAIVTRGRTLPAVAMGGQVYYNEFARGNDAGLDLADSTNRALLQAGVETISERISLGIIDDMLKSDKGLMRRFVGGMVLEQAQEQGATMGNRLVDWAYLDRDQTLDEFIAETPRYVIQTSLATLVASSGMQGTFLAVDAITQNLMKESVFIQRSPSEQRLDEIIEKVGKSKMGKNSPEKTADYVAQMTAGSDQETVTVDLDGLVETLEQSGADPAEVLEALGVDGYQAAQNWERFGEVEVKTADLLSNPKVRDVLTALRPHIRSGADQYTPAQKEVLREGFEAEVKAATQGIRDAMEGGQTLAEQEQAVVDRVRERLSASGMYAERAVLDATTAVEAAVVNTLARRLGIDPIEFFDQHFPRVQGSIDGMVMEENALESAKVAGYQGADTIEATQWLEAQAKGLDLSPEARSARAKDQGFTRRVYHETTPEVADTIESFDLGMRRGAASDPLMPVGVFTKPTSDDIGVGGDNPAQMSLLMREGSVLEVADRETLRAILMADPVYAEIAGQIEEVNAIYKDGLAAAEAADDGSQFARERIAGVLRNWEGDLSGLTEDARARATEILREQGYDTLHVLKDTHLDAQSVETWVSLDPKNLRSENAAFDPDATESESLLAQVDYNALLELAHTNPTDRSIARMRGKMRQMQEIGVIRLIKTADGTVHAFPGWSFTHSDYATAMGINTSGMLRGIMELNQDKLSEVQWVNEMDSVVLSQADSSGRWSGVRPSGFKDDMERGSQAFRDDRLNARQNKIFELYVNGYSAAEIAEEVEAASVGSVKATISQLQKKFPDLPRVPGKKGSAPVESERVRGLIDKGLSDVQISKITGKRPGTIGAHRFRYNRERKERGDAPIRSRRGYEDSLAQLIGPKAKSANKEILSTAKKMAKERVKVGKGLLAKTKPKYTRQQIWDETAKLGQPWYQDKNGDWISEIEDGVIVVRDGKGKMSEVIEFPSIYAEYPAIGRMTTDTRSRVKVQEEGGADDGAGIKGSFSQTPFMIGVNIRIADRTSTREYTVTHEVQHAVDSIEGREMGRKKPYYLRDTERRAFNTMYRRLMTMEERIARPPWETEDEAVRWWGAWRDMEAAPAKFTPPGTPDPGPTIVPAEKTMPQARPDENVPEAAGNRDLGMEGEIVRGTDYGDGKRADMKIHAPITALLGRTFLSVRELVRAATKNEQLAEIVGTATSRTRAEENKAVKAAESALSDRLMDMDAPLEAQPAAVRAFFEQMIEEQQARPDLVEGGYDYTQPGYFDGLRLNELIRELAFAQSAEAGIRDPMVDMIQRMRAAGIVGGKYVPGGRSAAEDGPPQIQSIVIFDERAPALLTDQSGNLMQERRGQFAPQQNVISLFEQSDVTTMLHEGAHWYLETMYRMATSENPHPFVTEQYNAILSWGKVGPDFQMYDANGRLTEEGRELHETWAETFEVYIQTGKAPTNALRDTFRAFKAWITALWKRMYGGGQPARANLNPEVIAIMDRMLAVDEEIEAEVAGIMLGAEAQAQALLDSGIITQAQYDKAMANLDEAREKAKEDFGARVMADKMREDEAWWNTEKRRVRGDVVRELDRSPIGRALSWLGYGQWKGDVPTSEAPGEDAAETEFYQSIRAATRMPMQEVDAWVRANITASESTMPNGDTLTVVRFPLNEEDGAPEVMLSIRMKADGKQSGRADVNLFLDNQMADALEGVEDVAQRGRMAMEMFGKALLVMRQYAAEYDPRAFSFTAAESQAEGTKAKSREALYRFMLSSMKMEGYTAYEVESMTSVVNEADGAKSANPMFPSAGFMLVKDGENVEDFARNEILRGNQRGGGAGEVVTVLTAKRLTPDFDASGRRMDPRGSRAGAADTGGALGQALPSAPTFYSALGRFISQSSTARAPAAQWKGMISNAPGVKAEEVEWTGVMEWLDLQDGPITREALAQFVEANGVRVEEVVRGAPAEGNNARLEEIQREMLPLIEENDRILSRQRELATKVDSQTITEEEKAERSRNIKRVQEISDLLVPLRQEEYNLSSRSGSDTKWSSYTLPGGENYREMLLTLPVTREQRADMLSRNEDGEQLLDPEEIDPGVRGKPDQPAFRSSHWSEPNVLAHVRFKEREHIVPWTSEEQAALKAWNDAQADLRAIDAELNPAIRSRSIERDTIISEMTEKYRLEVRAGRMTIGEMRRLIDEAIVPDTKSSARIKELQDRRDAIIRSLPKQPRQQVQRVLALEEIQSDWHQAGRERGYASAEAKAAVDKATADGIAARSEMIASLTDPSVVEKINARGTSSEKEMLAMVQRGMHVTDQHLRTMLMNFFRDPSLPDGVGARMNAAIKAYEASDAAYRAAQRAMQSAIPNAPFKNNAWTELVLKRMIRYAAENGFDAVAWIPGNIQNGRVVETEDNRGDFYDKIVPNAANKIGKKFGARVTQTPMDMPAQARGTGWENTGQPRQEQAGGPMSWWTLPITDELRVAAMTEGFPLFQPGDPKGWGETAPPPDLPPMRLDLDATERLYGKEAVQKLPKAIRDRGRDQTSIDSLFAIARAAAKTLRRKPPKSLFQFIRSRKARTVEGKTVPIKQWGIRGAADELKAMDRADLINEENGIHIDYMRELAEEAGYLGEGSTINDLLDAIDKEARGEPVYSSNDRDAVFEYQNAEEWAKWLDDQGVDITEKDEKTLRAKLAQVVTSTAADAVTPDQAAERLGFNSGQQLLDALAEIGNRERYIAAETERRMAQEFGDPYKDGTFAEAARQAAESEVKLRAAEIELEALARAVGETAASRMAKQMAEESLALMTVKELAGWTKFLDAERRHGRNALAATKKGDMAQAMLHKRRQLVSMHLAKAAREKSEALEKTRKDLMSYLTSKGRRDKIARDYLDKIEALLDQYELRVSKQTPGVQKARLSAKAYVEQMIADGREAEIAPEAMLLAEMADAKVWRTLTAEEADYLAGTVKNLAHLGRTKNKLLAAQDKRRFDAVVAELVDTLLAAPTVKDRSRSFTPTKMEQVAKGLREFDARLTRLEFQFQKLDGKDNGAIWNVLFRPFTEAADVETQMMRAAADRMKQLYGMFSAAERQQLFHRRVETPELAVPGRPMTMMDVVTIGLNWGNEGNRRALLDGYGWDAAAVEAVLNRVLTDKHWDFITGVWDLIGSYRDEAFALEKAITGVAPKAVEGVEFTLASGRVIKGKYYPLKYDGGQARADSVVISRLDEKQALSDLGKTFSKPMTKTGHLIERVGSGGKPVKIAIGVMHEHVQNVIHDIAYRKAVIDAHRIIRDPRFASAYMAAAGREQYDQLLPWLAAIATERNGDPGGIVTKIMQTGRRNMTVVAMGYKIGTAIQQATGALQGMTLIGPVYTAQGFVRALAGGPGSFWSAWKWVAQRSEFMRDRPQGHDRDTRMVTNRMQERTPLGAMQRNSMILTNLMDVVSSTIVWIGAYQKAMDGKAPNVAAGVEEDAIAWADSVVRQTQAAGRTQDLPQIMRGTETEKLVTMMYSYFSGLYNLTRKQATLARYGQMSRSAFIANLMILFVATPLMAATLAGRFPPDDEDEEGLMQKAGKEIASNAAGTLPIVRDLVNATLNPQFGYQMSPVGSGIDKLTKATARGLAGETLESDAAVREAIGALGILFGLPSSQLIITGDYVYDLMNGDEDPAEDPAGAAKEALLRNTR